MGKPTSDRAAIGHVIDGLLKADWGLVSVDDGGDEPEKVTTKPEAIDAIMAVDDATLWVEHDGNSERGWVRFVMGNDPEEVVCDHDTILSDAIDPVVQPWWED